MEREGVRLREQEPGKTGVYDISMREREAFLHRQQVGKVVVRAEDRQWEQAKQGRAKYYLHPIAFDDTALPYWKVFVHDIRTHSGRHVHQGGLVIYVLEGSGYTVVDGERIDWKEGDLLLLPIQPGGVEHQHFNHDPDQGCKWIAFIFEPFFDLVGSELTQKEISPDFRG